MKTLEITNQHSVHAEDRCILSATLFYEDENNQEPIALYRDRTDVADCLAELEGEAVIIRVQWERGGE